VIQESVQAGRTTGCIGRVAARPAAEPERSPHRDRKAERRPQAYVRAWTCPYNPKLQLVYDHVQRDVHFIWTSGCSQRSTSASSGRRRVVASFSLFRRKHS